MHQGDRQHQLLAENFDFEISFSDRKIARIRAKDDISTTTRRAKQSNILPRTTQPAASNAHIDNLHNKHQSYAPRLHAENNNCRSRSKACLGRGVQRDIRPRPETMLLFLLHIVA